MLATEQKHQSKAVKSLEAGTHVSCGTVNCQGYQFLIHHPDNRLAFPVSSVCAGDVDAPVQVPPVQHRHVTSRLLSCKSVSKPLDIARLTSERAAMEGSSSGGESPSLHLQKQQL
jgi:hypothetical protein